MLSKEGRKHKGLEYLQQTLGGDETCPHQNLQSKIVTENNIEYPSQRYDTFMYA